MMTNNVPTTGLIGVVCGDIIGLPYEFRGTRTKDFNFPLKLNDFSDDTMAAIAGGIAAATPSMAVPEAWAQACFRLLPEDYKSTVLQFQ